MDDPLAHDGKIMGSSPSHVGAPHIIHSPYYFNKTQGLGVSLARRAK